jgi:hypothetical protein
MSILLQQEANMPHAFASLAREAASVPPGLIMGASRND